MEITVKSPFPAEAVPHIWVWMQPFWRLVADDFAPKTVEEFYEEWKWRLSRDGARSWAVYRGEELGGGIVYDPWSPVAGAVHCVFKKTFWGEETTVPALEAAGKDLFEHGVRKLLFITFADNYPAQALAKRFGAQREGRFHDQALREGRMVDMIVYGITKEEYGTRSSVRRAGESKSRQDRGDDAKQQLHVGREPNPAAGAGGDAREAVGVRDRATR